LKIGPLIRIRTLQLQLPWRRSALFECSMLYVTRLSLGHRQLTFLSEICAQFCNSVSFTS